MKRVISLMIGLLLMLSLAFVATDVAGSCFPYAMASVVDDSDEEPDGWIDADELFGGGNNSEEPAVPALTFAGAAVVLHNDLGINFKVDSQLLKSGGYTSPYVVFSFGGKTLTVTNFTEADGKHVFALRNIAPHQLGQVITATLYATRNGELCQSEAITYSVSDYCYNMLETYKPENDPEGNYGELRTLLVDLLHYGAASQGYVGKAGEAVDGALTETQLAWGTAGDPALSSITNPSYATVEAPQVVWKSANLLLRDSVKVRVKFAADSLEGLCLKVTVDGVEYEIAAGEILPAETDGLYYVTFDRLNAAQLRQAIYFTAYKDGVAVSNTLRYSVESYACSYQSSPNAALSALVKAMIRYGDSAYAIIH